MIRFALLLLVLAGCDDIFDLTKVQAGPPDAPPDGLPDSPVDAPAIDPCQSTANVPPMITLMGTMADSQTSTPIEGLAVDAVPDGNAVTDVMGDFAIDVPTGGFPHVESFTTSGVPAYAFHRIFYQRPFTASTSDASTKLFQTITIDSIYNGRRTRTSTEATALISIRDCAGNGVAGATVSLGPGIDILYQSGGTSTDGSGVAYALFIPAGTIHIASSTTAAPYVATANGKDMLVIYLVAP